MTPTEVKYVDKLKELISWFGNYGEYVPYVIELKEEISALAQELEKEKKVNLIINNPYNKTYRNTWEAGE